MRNQAPKSFSIETGRLVIRPIDPLELGEFHAIARRREIAQNLASIPHPMSEDDASAWLAERAWRGSPDFVAGIFKTDGPLVGCIGISSDPITTYYFFAREYWGHGYATEVLNPFLDWCVKEFDLTEIKVGVLDDNPGSQRVLEKSGFRNTHATLYQPPFRDAPDRLLMYWKGYGASPPLATSTGRLYIHPIHPGHAGRLSELHEESDNFQLLGIVEPEFTPESAGQWIEDAANRSGLHRFAITRIDGLLSGASELTVDGNTATIRLWMGSGYWSPDYGVDAIRGLAGLIFGRLPKVEQVNCRLTRENPDLSKLLRTIGFEELLLDSARQSMKKEQAEGCRLCLTRASFERAEPPAV